MITLLKIGLVLGATVLGTVVLCPLCDNALRTAGAQEISVVAQTPDTATVRLHISRMTCGSCPATARLALKKLPGVYSATVTLDNSLGVVRYDPRRVKPNDIAAHLTRLTGFGATVLPDSTAAPRKSGSR
ncbi:MAG: heavy-metal-associated domain-containing protein [Gemmatimonadales bacterium]